MGARNLAPSATCATVNVYKAHGQAEKSQPFYCISWSTSSLTPAVPKCYSKVDTLVPYDAVMTNEPENTSPEPTLQAIMVEDMIKRAKPIIEHYNNPTAEDHAAFEKLGNELLGDKGFAIAASTPGFKLWWADYRNEILQARLEHVINREDAYHLFHQISKKNEQDSANQALLDMDVALWMLRQGIAHREDIPEDVKAYIFDNSSWGLV